MHCGMFPIKFQKNNLLQFASNKMVWTTGLDQMQCASHFSAIFLVNPLHPSTMCFKSQRIAACFSMVTSFSALGSALSATLPIVCGSCTGMNSETFIPPSDWQVHPISMYITAPLSP